MGEVQIRLQNMNNGSNDDSFHDAEELPMVLSEESSNESSNGDHYEDDINVFPADENVSDESSDAADPSDGLKEISSEASVSNPDDLGSEAGDSESEADDLESEADDSESEAGDLESEDSNSDDTLIAAMEAILFAMGEAVPIDSIAQALCVPKWKAMEMADVLAERYSTESSGVSLNWYEESVQLSTKPELYEYLIRIAAEPKKPKLTPTLLETLSIIAFRQPVTRMEVENIRGVNSDFAINRLISFDLVQEVGRKEVPGRPLLFGTTQQFLRSFGIRSVEELPEPDTSHMEAFREEAEEEVSSKLDI